MVCIRPRTPGDYLCELVARPDEELTPWWRRPLWRVEEIIPDVLAGLATVLLVAAAFLLCLLIARHKHLVGHYSWALLTCKVTRTGRRLARWWTPR